MEENYKLEMEKLIMPDKMFQVTVSIVTYQSRNTIGPALDALKKAYDDGIAAVVVVDNVSIDGTPAFITDHYPWVKLVRNTENVGFGRGCNIGVQYARTPYIMFLNPDAVIDIESLKTLLDFMDNNSNVGMCGPVLKGLTGEVRSVPLLPTPWRIVVNPLLEKWISGEPRFINPGDAPIITEWIRGVCMLLRKEVFDNIGGFDPRFFLYFEETDLCLRTYKSGWEIWIVGNSVCEHVNAASAKQTKAPLIFGDTISEHYFRSRFYYMVKHFGWLKAISAEIGEILFIFIRTIIDLIRFKFNTGLLNRFQAPILKLPSRIK